ncbi:MAG TPA: hypothetical protein VE029_02435 [Rhizobacter sp.]|nr:hypothetical protein [Rhizobacter sp.]
MKTLSSFSSGATALACAAAWVASSFLVGADAAHAAKPAYRQQSRPIPGQSLDDGLGDLPHYAHWSDPTGKAPLRNHVPGEKLDSGLGAFADQLESEFNRPLKSVPASRKK